jgi:sec-independent protein translocase protein TatA
MLEPFAVPQNAPALAFSFYGIGMPELIIIAIIVLLLFGNRLPSVMRSLGQSITEFKKGTREGVQDSDDGSNKQA